ncbi:eukaryotic translation initiation factor 4 gamma 1-like [Amia ocellicauda]|uniref:eukaryotic translation initiation factor 4 gamma 1-like n=1 Tax=Amia ocellicauda TaxID=2972642 RepID=UPI003464CD7C
MQRQLSRRRRYDQALFNAWDYRRTSVLSELASLIEGGTKQTDNPESLSRVTITVKNNWETVIPQFGHSGRTEIKRKTRVRWKYTPDEKESERQFLLDLQFICDRLQKLRISDVVLAKAINTPVHRLDPSQLTGMNSVPDLTPSLANLGIQPMGGHGPGSLPPQPSAEGARCSRQGKRKEPQIINVSFSHEVHLNKAEKAWKPTIKQAPTVGDDPEVIKTQELFRRVNGILNKLTPQMFQPLMRQVDELTIDTEQRLQGVMELIFEKAISEPNFSATYAYFASAF